MALYQGDKEKKAGFIKNLAIRIKAIWQWQKVKEYKKEKVQDKVDQIKKIASFDPSKMKQDHSVDSGSTSSTTPKSNNAKNNSISSSQRGG